MVVRYQNEETGMDEQMEKRLEKRRDERMEERMEEKAKGRQDRLNNNTPSLPPMVPVQSSASGSK